MKKTENDIFRSAVKRMKKEVLKATFKEADRMNALKEAMSYSRDDADPRYSGGPGKDDDYASDFAGIPGASRGEGEEDNETKMSMDKGDPLEDPEVEGEEGYSAVGEKHPGPDSGTKEVPHGEDLFEGHEDEREEHDHDKDAAKDDWDHIIKLAKDAHEDHVRRDDGEEGEEDRDRHRDAAEDDWAHIHALAKDAGMDKEDEDHLEEGALGRFAPKKEPVGPRIRRIRRSVPGHLPGESAGAQVTRRKIKKSPQVDGEGNITEDTLHEMIEKQILATLKKGGE